MDISLKSMVSAFEDRKYQREMGRFKLFAFVLVTPSDPSAFKSLLLAFDEVHYLTGADILIIGPSVEPIGGQLSRPQLAEMLEEYCNGTHGRETFSTFQRRQTEETYAFARHVGLPLDSLPCLVVFDTLVGPREYATVRFGGDHPDGSLATTLRRLLSHVERRCQWRTIQQIKIIAERALDRPNYEPRSRGLLFTENSLLETITSYEAQLVHLRKRLEGVPSQGEQTPESYQSSLRSLRSQIDAYFVSLGTANQPPELVDLFSRLESGEFDADAMKQLHEFRSNHRQRLPQAVFQAIWQVFNEAGKFQRTDRLRASIHAVQSRLDLAREELTAERNRLTDVLDELQAGVKVASTSPILAVCELPGARRFALTANQRPDLTRIRDPDGTTDHDSTAVEQPIENASSSQLMDVRMVEVENVTIDVVLLVAVRVELESVLGTLKPLNGQAAINRIDDWKSKRIYYLGKLGNAQVAVTMCRMGSSGRAASLMATYKAIVAWKPRFVVMVGIAFGSDKNKQSLGDVLVASAVHCYELQRVGSGITIQRGPSPECGEMLVEAFHNLRDWHFIVDDTREARLIIGPMLSGEKLIDDRDFKSGLLNAYPSSIGGEIEAAGVYSAASTEGVEWIVVKGICDWADGSKNDGWQPVAAKAAVSAVEAVLGSLF